MPCVLIVDDHPDIRRLLSLTLGRDYEVLEADGGIVALEMVKRHHPSVVLLDVMMPGEMDGLQVLDAIKKDPQTRDIVVAMVSARGQVVDRDDALRRGAAAYFVKPFSPLQMVSWLKEQLK